MKDIRSAAAHAIVLGSLTLGVVCAQAPDSLLPATPAQMLGPYYPLQPEQRADHDLTYGGKAHGRPLDIVGRVQDTHGRPLPGILVEIWQTNAHGRYHHPHDASRHPIDPGFRGYGRTQTDTTGAYHFSTIRPTAYPGRTPHVHFRLSRAQQELLVTQMYLPEGPNLRDGLFMAIDDPVLRTRLIGVPNKNAADELRFDIVIDTQPFPIGRYKASE